MIGAKRLCLAVAITACQIVALSAAHAATYYVRPGGNNANDGLSWATAWAHPNRAQSQFTASGHTLVIAPGSYDTVQFVPPAAGGAQTVYACSSWAASGSDAGRNNTFIRGGRNQNLTWTSIGGNRWTTTFDSPGGGVVSNNGEYVAFFRDGVTMRPRQSAGELDEQNEYSYNTSGGLTTLYSTTNPNSSTWRVCWRPVMFLGRNQSNVMIYGLNIQEGSQRLFILTESGSGMPKCDSIYIYHCNLSKVSDLQIAHNTSIIYCGEIGPSSVSDWSNAIEVVGCSLSTVISVGEGTGVHAGSAIEYYFARDSRIDSNVFVGPMSVAIALKMGCYPDNGNKSLNWSVKYNRISGCVDEAVWISNKVGNVDFIGNILERNECAFDIHTSSPCGNDPTQGNIVVSHNTFIDNQVNFTASAANAIGGNKVMYNIFSDTVATTATNYEYTIGFRLRGGEAPLETPSTETYWANGVNYNMYYSANGGEPFAANFTSNSGFVGYPNPTWAQWRAHFDAASVTGINPKFNASHLGDYSRPNSAAEINVTEYGRTWTVYGAWQPSGGSCTVPPAPSLVSPTNGITGLLEPILLDWSDVSGATSYQVQIDNNSDFSSPLVSQVTGASTYSAVGLTAGVTLYWRVCAQNSCGTSSWSASRTFASICTPGAIPTLSTPANGATGLSQPVVLDWSDVVLPLAFQVQVDNNSDFSSPNIDQQTLLIASNYAASGLTAGTTYYWRVRSQNLCGWGAWSASRTFAVAGSDVTAPTISVVAATNITENSALVSWTTNESSSTQINYGTTTSYSLSTTLVPALVTAHQQTLTGLSPSTTYHYRVRSRDAAGNEAVSGDYVFTTSDVMTRIDTGITPTVSSTYPGFSPARINDGVLNPFGWENSTWASTESATDAHWVEFNFGANKQVKRVVVYWAWNGDQSRWMTSQQFKLQSWSGSAYVDAVTTNIATAESTTVVNISPVTTTRLRYYQPANMGPSTFPTVVWLAELDVYGAGSTNTAPTVPGPTSPANAAQVSTVTPTLTLANSSDTEGNTLTYDFQVSTSSSFSTITAQATAVAQGGSGATSWVASPNLAGGTTYYWRVRAFDGSLYSSYSASRSFTVSVNTAPTVPTLSSPVAGAQVGTLTPTLTIGNSTDPQGNTITYDIQVSASSAFATIAAQTTGLVQGGSGSTSWIVSPSLVTGTTYYWRARAFDGALYSSYTAYRSFSIASNSAPSTPTLSSPAAGATVGSLTPTLIVNNSSDAQGNTITYNFQVSTSSSFSTITAQVSALAQGTNGTTSWIVSPTLSSGATYYWRVRAYDGSLYSTYSANRSFITGSNSAPGAPTPQSPANYARISDLTPDLIVGNAVDPNGDPLTYQFELYNSAGAILLAQSPMVTSGANTTSWTVSITLAYATYYTWRVRAYDGQAWSVWTALREFRTNRAPSSPSVGNPAFSKAAQNSAQSLGAGAAVDPDGDSIVYEFEVFAVDDTTQLLKSATVPASSGTTFWKVPTDLPASSEFQWRVRASDGEAASDWTTLARFTTVAASECGDQDASGRVDISDALYLLNYVFSNGPEPTGAGDVNCDEITDVSDAVFLIEYLYANGSVPCAKCGH